MTSEKTDRFRALHKKGAAFLIPNPWDAGSARILQKLGFVALATTSSGFALTQGRRDYAVTREDAIAHCRAVAGAVDIPVTADLENGFGDTPEDVSETIRQASETGLCGGSIEDFSGDEANPIYDQAHAVERIAAAVEAARAAPAGFVLTARAEAFLHGQGDLDAVIARLNAFAAAGAEVLYAPGLPDMDAVRAVCAGVEKPVNVLITGKLRRHSVADFAETGAARLSIGGTLAYAAYASLADAAGMLSDGAFDALSIDRERAALVSEALKD
ncbi:MAG: isocitrate lyase/phosphoenolpyruvate mutase family protein [Pseudomonadota bacterium]